VPVKGFCSPDEPRWLASSCHVMTVREKAQLVAEVCLSRRAAC